MSISRSRTVFVGLSQNKLQFLDKIRYIRLWDTGKTSDQWIVAVRNKENISVWTQYCSALTKYVSVFSRRWVTPTNTICLTTANQGRFWFAATRASDAASVPQASASWWVFVLEDIKKKLPPPRTYLTFTLPPLPAWTKHPQVSKVLLPPTWRGSGDCLCPQKTKSWWGFSYLK